MHIEFPCSHHVRAAGLWLHPLVHPTSLPALAPRQAPTGVSRLWHRCRFPRLPPLLSSQGNRSELQGHSKTPSVHALLLAQGRAAEKLFQCAEGHCAPLRRPAAHQHLTVLIQPWLSEGGPQHQCPLMPPTLSTPQGHPRAPRVDREPSHTACHRVRCLVLGRDCLVLARAIATSVTPGWWPLQYHGVGGNGECSLPCTWGTSHRSTPTPPGTAASPCTPPPAPPRDYFWGTEVTCIRALKSHSSLLVLLLPHLKVSQHGAISVEAVVPHMPCPRCSCVAAHSQALPQPRFLARTARGCQHWLGARRD